MSKNTGIPYEILTKQIFDQILNQNSVKTIEIKHNVILKGKTISHQIDVYWEFETGGINYYTVVQAKDWNQTVSQGSLLQFKAILDDLPNQPRGIFITKTGYQQGALDYAKSNGIILYELRKPTDKDLENRIKTIVLNLTAFIPHSSGVTFIPDDEWIRSERKKLNIDENEKFELRISGMEDEIMFYNSDNNVVSNVHKIIQSFYPAGFQEISPTLKTHTFTESTFINTGIDSFPKLKINGIQATISVSKSEEVIKIGGEDFIKFILKNVIDDSENIFDKNLKKIR